MHYHTEVGIPISSFGKRREHRDDGYGEVLADVQKLTNFILRKYQQDLELHEMRSYGIEPFWYDEEGDECDEDHDEATPYNPQNLWDWWVYGGRWKGIKAPPKYKDMFESEDSPEIISTPHGDRVKTFWDTLHTSFIGDDITTPIYIVWLNEDWRSGDESGIEYINTDYLPPDISDGTFKDMITSRKRWKDYVWVTCDLHN